MTGNQSLNPSLTDLEQLIKEWWGGDAANQWYAGLNISSSIAPRPAPAGTSESTKSEPSTAQTPALKSPGTADWLPGLDGPMWDTTGLFGGTATSKPDDPQDA